MPEVRSEISHRPRVAVVGGGPAGLMSAEVLVDAGLPVDLYDAMPSVGRKFLLAGKGGLNLTHGEPMAAFLDRFGERREQLAPMLAQFGPAALRTWAAGLGVQTFVGSSGRVFPVDLKAAPLLRAWLHRLRAAGLRLHMRHHWVGWGESGRTALRFEAAQGEVEVTADAVLLALGGASWPQLGSDGKWQALLQERGVELAPLQPSNCGFDVQRQGADGQVLPGWSEHFRSRHAGQPLKNVALSLRGPGGRQFASPGEFVVTETGVEGSLVYAASSMAREQTSAHGHAEVLVDLLPARNAQFVIDEVTRPRGSRSLSTHLKSRLGIDGVKAALLHELLPRAQFADLVGLAAAIKALPLTLAAARPIGEAISSAGGVRFEALDRHLMLRAAPGVFCAGEMLDWEAPTGGYLLQACFATGAAAGRGVLARLGVHAADHPADTVDTPVA